MWFDGANGEGPNGKRQVYDWPSYYRVVRELQPKAVIFGMAPDVRWVGTESGYGRETEWSVVPLKLRDGAVLRPDSPHPLDDAFVPGDLTAQDLGSRDAIRTASVLAWYPAETDVSIRPGWFYHAKQDAQVKTPEKLVDIYFSSVGRNGLLLLNVPPDTRGRIADADAKSLLRMRAVLDRTFGASAAEARPPQRVSGETVRRSATKCPSPLAAASTSRSCRRTSGRASASRPSRSRSAQPADAANSREERPSGTSVCCASRRSGSTRRRRMPASG